MFEWFVLALFFGTSRPLAWANSSYKNNYITVVSEHKSCYLVVKVTVAIFLFSSP